MPPLRTVRRSGEARLEIRGSRFLGTVARVGDEDAARAVVASQRRQHWDATHHCSAYVVGDLGAVHRSQDDGEPPGTAGQPMLEVLRGRRLTEVVAVVTRWFGGVKLGAGGLVRAYGAAVSAALDEAGALELRPVLLLAVETDLAHAGSLEAALRGGRWPVRDTLWGQRVRILVAVPGPEEPTLAATVASHTHGAATVTRAGRDTLEVPVPWT